MSPQWSSMALAGFAALTGAVASLAVRRKWLAWRLRRRMKRASRGEQLALRLVERSGFRVVEQQVVRYYDMSIDGAAQRVAVRADMVAKSGRHIYVVEVKTGAAAKATAPITRRQLLEYQHAYNAHGILLADMEQKRLVSIAFEKPRRTHTVLTMLIITGLVLVTLAGVWAGYASSYFWPSHTCP